VMKRAVALELGSALSPEVARWSRPDRSAAAEERSLRLQARSALKGRVPSVEERTRVVEALAAQLPKVPFNAARLRPQALVALEGLKPSASPGYPYMKHAASNKDARVVFGDEMLVSLALERLERLVSVPVDELKTWGARRYVSEFLRDPCRVFGKNEVHSVEKVATGRLRLIYSVSIVDQLVERILNSPLGQEEIKRWESLPCCPGMGLQDDGLRSVEAKIKQMPNPAGTDVSGWDFGVKQWMMDDEASVRSIQCGWDGPSDSSYWHLIAIVAGCTLVVLSNGRVYEQDDEQRGVMDSGRYITSSGNSKTRCIVKAHAFPETSGVMAMGDDCVEDLPAGTSAAEVVRRYATIGIRIKEVEIFRDLGHVEFCSYRFNLASGVEPVRWHKMLATFLATWPAEEAVLDRHKALMSELRHSPQRDAAMEVVRQVAVLIGRGAQ
jgi:hypothetical protein